MLIKSMWWQLQQVMYPLSAGCAAEVAQLRQERARRMLVTLLSRLCT